MPINLDKSLPQNLPEKVQYMYTLCYFLQWNYSVRMLKDDDGDDKIGVWIIWHIVES